MYTRNTIIITRSSSVSKDILCLLQNSPEVQDLTAVLAVILATLFYPGRNFVYDDLCLGLKHLRPI